MVRSRARSLQTARPERVEARHGERALMRRWRSSKAQKSSSKHKQRQSFDEIICEGIVTADRRQWSSGLHSWMSAKYIDSEFTPEARSRRPELLRGEAKARLLLEGDGGRALHVDGARRRSTLSHALGARATLTRGSANGGMSSCVTEWL